MQKELFSLQEIDNFLYTSAKSDFSDFDSMSRYLDSIDIALDIKISQLEEKREEMLNQYKTTAMVYEINSKRRKKEEAEMKEEGDRLAADQARFEKATHMPVHPMTSELTTKTDDLERMEETGEVLNDLKALLEGHGDSVLPLDDRNFERSASRISVLKTVLEDLTGSEYAPARELIDKKFSELHDRILNKFQEGYWKKNTKQLKDVLPLCSRFGMLEEVSDFYIRKVFREAQGITTIDVADGKALQAEVNSLFYLLQRSFRQALELEDSTTGEPNEQQLFRLFGDYSENVLKVLINYAFEDRIKGSLDNVLKCCLSNEQYLTCLELFYDEGVALVRAVQTLDPANDLLNHLVDSYFITLFDNYLEQYAYKELGFLEDKYEQCTRAILSGLSLKATGMGPVDKRKFDWKRLFQDYKLEQTDKLTAQDMDERISSILSIFMNVSLERLFEITNKSLQRNRKIARHTDREKQQVRILDLFGKEMGDFLINLIKYTATVVPSFNRKTPLSEQFFEIVPQLSTLVQRLELVFQTYAVSKASLNEAIRMEQHKEDIIQRSETELQKLLQVALASLLVTENSLLKESSDYRQQTTGQSATPGVTKLIQFVGRYLRRIRKNYSTATQKRITEKMGLQFCDLLIQHFATVAYSKVGLYQLFIDVGHIKKFMFEFESALVEEGYAQFKALLDMYLLKNDEASLRNHINEEKERSLAHVKDEVINRYLENKRRNELS